MQAHGPRIPETKPTPKPEANQYPVPFQKPIVDTNSGGIRIIPIQVDPGYQPKREANIVFGERYCFILSIHSVRFLFLKNS